MNIIDKKWPGMNNHITKVFHFSGARIRDMSQLIQPIIKEKPKSFILHSGTNHSTTNYSRKIVDHILLLKILKSLPDCRVTVYKPEFRSDNARLH